MRTTDVSLYTDRTEDWLSATSAPRLLIYATIFLKAANIGLRRAPAHPRFRDGTRLAPQTESEVSTWNDAVE